MRPTSKNRTDPEVYGFIFRRDLRVPDNTALERCVLDAAQAGARVAPLFIFQERQIRASKNPYYSARAVQFMLESLQELDQALGGNLGLWHAAQEGDRDALEGVRRACPRLTRVYCNADITPFARRRDARVRDWCSQQGIAYHAHSDYNLLDDLSAAQPYQVYGPFWKRYGAAARPRIRKPAHGPAPKMLLERLTRVSSLPVRDLFKTYGPRPPPANHPERQTGGRAAALALLKRVSTRAYSAYARAREFPGKRGATTRMSAYMKFGCVSVREVYWAAVDAYGPTHALVKELFWREFYDQVAFHFPRVLEGQVLASRQNQSLRTRYDRIRWDNAKPWFHAWKNGATGFPLVDAAMRELKQTGYMHNRMRMVVASFLVKDLWIDWRWGERYFATQLTDYYAPANNGGWTFASGSGADAQQYNRIFNPWLQSKKYDADATYIKRWLPELATVPAADLHRWNLVRHKYSKQQLDYPEPIVDHAERASLAKKRYRRCLKIVKNDHPSPLLEGA